MPKLDTKIHVEMLRRDRERTAAGFVSRLKLAFSVLFPKPYIYGKQWGDPENSPSLVYFKNRFLLPYISKDKTVVEIGPGGGRWTQYMLEAEKIYAVEFYEELLREFKTNFNTSKVVAIQNHGDDFPGIPSHSVDFIFAFGVFVHLDIDVIDAYLRNMKSLLRAGANVVLHYSDDNKWIAQNNASFSKNNPETMRKLVLSHGYSIFEEDTVNHLHSAVIRFGMTEK